MKNQITKYNTTHGQVELSPGIIKEYLVNGDSNKVTEQEVTLFLELCKAQKLNPFIREAYLVKFGTSPAQLIVGKDVFLKRAKQNPDFKGFEAGIIIENVKGEIEHRAGTFYTKNETLIGGYCKVFIKDWDIPLEHTVALSEFNKTTATWKNMPAVMIRKVALVQALREAFIEDFQAMYSEEEMDVESDNLPRDEVVVKQNDTISPEQSKHLMEVVENEVVVAFCRQRGYRNTGDIKIEEYHRLLSLNDKRKKEDIEEIEDAEIIDESDEYLLDVDEEALPFN